MKKLLFITFAFILSGCQNDTWDYELPKTSSTTGDLSLEQLREQRDKREEQEQQRIYSKHQQIHQQSIENNLLKKLMKSDDLSREIKKQASELLKKNKEITELNKKTSNKNNSSDPYKDKTENLFDF